MRIIGYLDKSRALQQTASMVNRVIVIGAGAAGMMAAGRAAELGANVLLLEKMERPGKKILMTGNGRCNFTNACDADTFISQFGPNGRFLYPSFSRFFRDKLIEFFHRQGLESRTGFGGKVFPASDNARDVVRALEKYLEAGKATLQTGTPVTGIVEEKGRVTGVRTPKELIPAASVIIATGGTSHRQTGSSGDGYRMAAELGHTMVKLRPGLVPLVVGDIALAKQMQGASLRKVKVTAFQCPSEQITMAQIPNHDTGRGIEGKPPRKPLIESRTGDAIITHFGLSGPVVLEMSLAIVDALEEGPVSMSIDLLPKIDERNLAGKLQRSFDEHGNKSVENLMKGFLTPRLAAKLVGISGIPHEKAGNQITAVERERLAGLIKRLSFDIMRPYNMDTAMVTQGGVSLDEVDPSTMASKLVKGLYLCGEVLDLAAGTGGYNLQAAFSTGWMAGERGERSLTKSAQNYDADD